MRWTTACMAAMLVTAMPAVGAEILTNGGFETGTLAGWVTYDGTTYAGGPESAHSGQHGAVFVLGAGQLQQQFSTVPGDVYKMSLWVDIPDLNPDRLNEVSASITDYFTGTGSRYYTYDVTPFPYKQIILPDFVAQSRHSVVNLSFYSGAYNDFFTHRTGSPVDWYVDDVSVTGTPYSSTPEPATWALLLTGFGFAGMALRRQRVTRQRPTT